MRKPVTINIGSAGKATDNVTQHIIMAKDNDKPRLLEDWINEVRGGALAGPASSARLVPCSASEMCVLGSWHLAVCGSTAPASTLQNPPAYVAFMRYVSPSKKLLCVRP